MKSCEPPCSRAKPGLNAPHQRPEAPCPELADDEATTRLEHARHLADGLILLPDETQHGHSDDTIERGVPKRQRLGTAFNELELELDGLGHAATPRGRKHLWIGIDSADSGAAARKRACEHTVATGHIQDAQPFDRAEQLENEPFFEPVRDLPRWLDRQRR
jgi:hypothetical protein